MTRRTQAGVLALCVAAGATMTTLPISHAWARDPGNVETRAGGGGNTSDGRRDGGGTTSDGFVSERIDPAKLHPPSHVEPPARPLYERVEGDIDRGNGRIEDEQTNQLRQLERDRAGQQNGTTARRAFERFQQDLDRRQRIDRKAADTAKDDAKREAATKANDAVAHPAKPEPLAEPFGSPLARYVAQQQRLLDAAREKYQADLAHAEAERDAAVRTSTTREARSQAGRRFEQRRGELTKGYQAYRKMILGED